MDFAWPLLAGASPHSRAPQVGLRCPPARPETVPASPFTIGATSGARSTLSCFYIMAFVPVRGYFCTSPILHNINDVCGEAELAAG